MSDKRPIILDYATPERRRRRDVLFDPTVIAISIAVLWFAGGLIALTAFDLDNIWVKVSLAVPGWFLSEVAWTAFDAWQPGQSRSSARKGKRR